MKVTKYEIDFLQRVAAEGSFARSENLPQLSYPDVGARRKCREWGLVKYHPREARKGYWYLTDAGRTYLTQQLKEAP